MGNYIGFGSSRASHSCIGISPTILRLLKTFALPSWTRTMCREDTSRPRLTATECVLCLHCLDTALTSGPFQENGELSMQLDFADTQA